MNWPEDYIDKIICGDALDLINSLPDESIDLVVTDPPYDLDVHRGSGVGGRSAVKIYKKINKNFGNNFDPTETLQALLPKLKLFNAYFWCSVRQIRRYLEFAEANNLFYDILMYHKKNPIPLTNNWFLPDTEYCVYMRESPATFNNKIGHKLLGKHWTEYRVMGKNHPTPKPINIFRNHVAVSSNPGDIVLDPFVGSGTLPLAAESMGRQFVAGDINPEYCEEARRFLEAQKSQERLAI